MALFEWKITDCGSGEFGYIWIAEDGMDDFGPLYRVYIDPTNENQWLSKSTEGMDLNHVSNVIDSIEAREEPWSEWQYPGTYHRRILFYWRKIGSPVADHKAPGYEAPWFPWREAGFTAEERDECMGSNDRRT